MKRWTRRLLTALAAMVMLTATTGSALAAGGNTASGARSGVARVVVPYEADLYDPGTGEYAFGLTGYSSGSAFGVGDAGEETDVFVTNRHVVLQEDGPIDYGGETYYADYTIIGYYVLLDNYAYNTDSFELDSSRAVPCTVVYIGEEEDEDVAVLRAANPVPGRVALPLLGDEDALEVGDTVTALGYPGSSDDATSEGYLLASVDDVTVTSGVVSRFFDSVSAVESSGLIPGHLIQSTAPINSGNSGGPLIDENGAVVGINTYTYSGRSQSVTNSYYALRVQYAKDALDSLGIEYDVYTSGPSVLLIAAVTAAVLVVVAIIALLSVRGKKRSGRERGSAPSPVPPVDETGPVPTPAPAERRPDPNDSGFRIQGLSGALEGRRYLIGRQGVVVLGRDPAQCGVVFPGDTPGVSARHCAVWLENGGVYLKDLGSSHGTFLAPGRRLTTGQAVRLMPGETFFLGSQDQSFVIAERR